MEHRSQLIRRLVFSKWISALINNKYYPSITSWQCALQWKSPRINIISLYFHPVVIKRWSPDFFRLLLSNCSNWKINCDDLSSLSKTGLSLPRTAILQAVWNTMMENWLCLPMDDTISTCRPTIAALGGSMWMWTARRWPWFNPLLQGKAIIVLRTQLVFSTWNLVKLSRLFRLTTTVKFTRIPTTTYFSAYSI